MHHAPAGPPLSSRVAGLLARLRFRAAGLLSPLGAMVLVVRRARVLPVALGALVLGASALAAPLAPYDDDARSTAALSSTDDGLVPATGDWSQDGAPAVTSPSGEDSSSSSSSSVPSSSESSATAGEATGSRTGSTTAGGSTGSSAGSSSASSSAGTASSEASSSSSSTSRASSSSSRAPSSSDSAATGSPSGTSSTPRETEAPAADPADQVLASVNAARTDAGCAALTADAGLASLAAEHSAAMRAGDFVAVRSPDGGSPLDRGSRTAVVATGSDPAAVADGWSADASLLDCSLTSAGVGTTGGYWALLAA